MSLLSRFLLAIEETPISEDHITFEEAPLFIDTKVALSRPSYLRFIEAYCIYN